ncbi:YgfZ/GcvT domain-containing protein [Arcanobacterium pinnipediorum]|uniref:Folate-binding protein n=1 Tax=Arcanobacterium pinnipediorum TaxID=1503041 RepID=A0ABY5AHA9_9ACTO|nr:folate-binding protein [Arcanobacterium pinnipediorum]USR79599.1 folate-binding protein [Arcanobacterium pinnipediorum]
MSVISTFPGAVILDGERVPAHYGNPFAEEQSLRQGRSFTMLDREVLAVRGADRLKLLHLISSRNFEQIEAGESTEMLILDAHGHITHAAGAISDADTTWLITDHGYGQSLAEHIAKMTFMMRVETELLTDVVVFGLMNWSGQIPAELAQYTYCVWEDPWPHTAQGGATYGVDDDEHPGIDTRRSLVVVDPQNVEDALQALHGMALKPAGYQAWEAARIVDWRPALSFEAARPALPHELDWLRTGVHLEKGCYPGQETVAKLVNLGKPPRRLVFLYLEGGEELPAPGSAVTVDGRNAGEVTSVARSVEDGPVALALLKRNVPLDAVVSVGDFVASQVEIVSREGKSSASPDIRPGSGLSARRLGGPPPSMASKSLGGK